MFFNINHLNWLFFIFPMSMFTHLSQIAPDILLIRFEIRIPAYVHVVACIIFFQKGPDKLSVACFIFDFQRDFESTALIENCIGVNFGVHWVDKFSRLIIELKLFIHFLVVTVLFVHSFNVEI